MTKVCMGIGKAPRDRAASAPPRTGWNRLHRRRARRRDDLADILRDLSDPRSGRGDSRDDRIPRRDLMKLSGWDRANVAVQQNTLAGVANRSVFGKNHR